MAVAHPGYRLYDAPFSPNYMPYASFMCHSAPSKTALSYNGHMMASLHEDYLLEVRNVNTPSMNMSIRSEDFVKLTDVAWRRFYNDVITSSFDTNVRVWDIETRTVAHMWSNHKLVDLVTCHPDGNLIALASMDNPIRLWDVRGNTLVYSFDAPFGLITSISFSPSGNKLLVSSLFGTIVICNLPAARELCRFSIGRRMSPIPSAMFSTERNIITSETNVLKMWTAESRDTIVLLKDFSGHISKDHNTSANFAIAEQQYVIMGSEDGTVHIWDIVTNETLQTFFAHDNAILRVAALPSENVLITSSMSNDKTVKIWKRGGF